MKQIILSKIIAEVFDADESDELDLQLAITLNPDIRLVKAVMLETAKRILQLTAENAKSNMIMVEDNEGDRWPSSEVDKESILNVINSIK